MARTPLSLFVITLDEEANIGRCLDSAKGLAAEMVVVDSGSTDRTCEIAEARGARVVRTHWRGYGPQKRFAEDQCAHDLVLNLDADEILSPALREEISGLLGNETAPFYRVARYQTDLKTGKTFWSWRPARIVRLYDRRAGRFSEAPVHEGVVTGEAPVRMLSGPLLHVMPDSLASIVAKYNHYTDLSAEQGKRRPLAVLLFRFVFEPVYVFLKLYLTRGLILYGLRGFGLAVMFSFFRWLRIAKMLEVRLGW